MSIQNRKTDFNLAKSSRESLTWNLRDGGVPYETGSKIYKLEVWDRAEPRSLIFTITPATDQGTGYVAMELQSTHTVRDGQHDYILSEQVSAGQFIPMGYGVINFIDLLKYVPFTDLVKGETPGGLEIPLAFIHQKSLEYRSIFKLHINAAIELSDVQIDSSWPLLYNMLIAKLTVHDYLLKGLQGTLVQGAPGEGNSANIKSIETGPAKVEFLDRTRGLSDFMKTSNGISAFDSLRTDLCGLAAALKIRLRICPERKHPILFEIAGNSPCTTSWEILSKWY